MSGPPVPLATVSSVFVNTSLKPWAQIGLDLSNSTFSKLYMQYEKTMDKKYNLKPKIWESFKHTLLDKAIHCCLNEISNVTNNVGKVCNIIMKFLLLTTANIKASLDQIWTGVKV